MIEARATGLVLALTGAATATGTPVPVVWHLLGYPFEAAGMIAALFGCACARLWSAEQLRMRKSYRWTLDIPITAITFAVTMGVIISRRPEPLLALGMGIGIGVIGEGLFKLAQRQVERIGLFGEAPHTEPYALPPSPTVPPDMADLTRKLDEEPKP